MDFQSNGIPLHEPGYQLVLDGGLAILVAWSE